VTTEKRFYFQLTCSPKFLNRTKAIRKCRKKVNIRQFWSLSFTLLPGWLLWHRRSPSFQEFLIDGFVREGSSIWWNQYCLQTWGKQRFSKKFNKMFKAVNKSWQWKKCLSWKQILLIILFHGRVEHWSTIDLKFGNIISVFWFSNFQTVPRPLVPRPSRGHL